MPNIAQQGRKEIPSLIFAKPKSFRILFTSSSIKNLWSTSVSSLSSSRSSTHVETVFGEPQRVICLERLDNTESLYSLLRVNLESIEKALDLFFWFPWYSPRNFELPAARFHLGYPTGIVLLSGRPK